LKAQAGEPLRRYYGAFADIDELIDAVAAFITHRVAKGPLDELEPFDADWSAPAELRHTRFRAFDTQLIRHPYDLVKATLGVRALSGVILLRNVTSNWKPTGDVTLTADGRLLAGSADIPAAPSEQ